jgi:hypothetical protein
MTTDKTMPGPDDLVQARRRRGFGTINADVRNLTTPKDPTAPIQEGHLIEMRFREAVEREDFEAVGWEHLTAADLEPATAEKG